MHVCPGEKVISFLQTYSYSSQNSKQLIMICPGFRLEDGISNLDDASTKLGLWCNIHDSLLQITYHRFLKLVYPDAVDALWKREIKYPSIDHYYPNQHLYG